MYTNEQRRAHRKKIDGVGFLVALYGNMKGRVRGQQQNKAHLYAGKEILSPTEFYQWASESAEFHKLFKAYVESGYSRKLAPSVDRIDSSKGYFLSNMEWVTHSVNSSRGAISRWKKVPQCES